MGPNKDDFYDAYLTDYALTGKLGPKIQKLAQNPEFPGCDLWDKLTHEQALEVGQEADRAYWEKVGEEAQAKYKAQREDALLKEKP